MAAIRMLVVNRVVVCMEEAARTTAVSMEVVRSQVINALLFHMPLVITAPANGVPPIMLLARAFMVEVTLTHVSFPIFGKPSVLTSVQTKLFLF